MPLQVEALTRLCGVAVGSLVNTALGIVPDDADVDETDQADAVAEIVEALKATTAFGWDTTEWNEVLSNIRAHVISSANEVSRLVLQTPVDAGERSDELDETSLAVSAVELEAHGVAVGAHARLIAERTGISSELVEILELAGLLHDAGRPNRAFSGGLIPKPGRLGSSPVQHASTSLGRYTQGGGMAQWRSPRGSVCSPGASLDGNARP